MTNILLCPTTITSTPPRINIPVVSGKSFASTPKSPLTLVIQSPSLNFNQSSTLLTKRQNAAELGDLLMKKIKSKGVKIEDNSSQNGSNFEASGSNSPLSSKVQENVEDNSMVEEAISPYNQSVPEDLEIPQAKKFSLAQRNSLLSGKLASKLGARDSQTQLSQALELLQKKMFIQKVAALTESLLKEQLAKEPLYIPPFVTEADPIKVQKDMFTFNNGEEEPKVIIGPVEYPLLSMAPTNDNTLLKIPASSMLFAKAPNASDRSLLESLCVTRAETQRSESDAGSSQVNEESLQAGKGRKKRATKKGEAAEKVKTQKKERKQTQVKGKGKNTSCLSEISQSP